MQSLSHYVFHFYFLDIRLTVFFLRWLCNFNLKKNCVFIYSSYDYLAFSKNILLILSILLLVVAMHCFFILIIIPSIKLLSYYINIMHTTITITMITITINVVNTTLQHIFCFIDIIRLAAAVLILCQLCNFLIIIFILLFFLHSHSI